MSSDSRAKATLCIRRHSTSVTAGRLETVGVALPLLVGRTDRANPKIVPDIALDFDPRVSRRHARFSQQGSQWFVEDMGSKHGTQLDDLEIKGLGLVEYPPGASVILGDTTCVAIPQEWLFIRHDQLIILGPCAATLNYAMMHCGTPFIGALEVWNAGELVSKELDLAFDVEGYSDRCHITVPALQPNEKMRFPPLSLPFHRDRVRCQVTPQITSLRSTVNGEIKTECSRDVLVLGFRDYVLDTSTRLTIGAFVSPHNPIVERIVAGAHDLLARQGKGDTFESILQSGGEDAELRCLEAMYQSLAGRRIEYMKPQAQKLSGHDNFSYQSIRSPESVAPDGGKVRGRATCLDLAVLFAGCLENIGLNPLIFFTRGESDLLHAFAGCWVGSLPGPRPILEDFSELQEEVAGGFILPVETTGISTGYTLNAAQLSFPEALEFAVHTIKQASELCAVDIGALRPPHGAITPLEAPFTPEVALAVTKAWELARTRHTPGVELTFLLYGLIAAQGRLIREFLLRSNLDAAYLLDQCSQLLPDKQHTCEPKPTKNFDQCLHSAFGLAQLANAQLVREQDLIQALIHQSHQSKSLQSACKTIGLDIDDFTPFLKELDPACDRRMLDSGSFIDGD